MHDLLPFIPPLIDQALSSIHYFMPEIYLSVLFVLVLVTDLLFGKTSAWICRVLACVGLLIVIFQDLSQSQLLLTGNKLFFGEMLLLTHTTVIFKLMIDLFSVITLLYFTWDDQLRSHKKGLSDLYSIAIAFIFGLHLMAMAVNLLTIYLSIEMVSLGSYLMVAYRSDKGLSAEAGLKYVLFGAAASAVMLYGISLLYGFGGTLDLFNGVLVTALSKIDPVAVSMALILFFVGIGFKLSFVPMHFWVPDIYEGAPTPVAAFLSIVSKIAGFSLLVNFLVPFLFLAKGPVFDFRLLFSVISIFTMVAGNFAAVLQKNVKRMLAYSSIAHTGFALMALVNFDVQRQGIIALSFYLFVYSLANIGAWMLASYFSDNANAENMDEYRGLGFKFPLAGVCFVIILISLTGLPLSAGFYGKFLTFSAVYQVYQLGHNIWPLLLMITGAVTTVVSLVYYIRIPLNLFLRKADRSNGFASSTPFLLTTVAIITLLIVYLGLFPDFLTKYL
ncbi:MAG: NADH-quinone oxidoreductase subunit N [Mucilaginibacter sp.]